MFWLGISLPTLALLAMAWLVHQSGGQFRHSFSRAMQAYQVLDLYEQTMEGIVDAESNQRGYLLTGQQEYLEPYRAAIKSIHDDIAQLKKMTRDSASQQANLATLEKMVDRDLMLNPDQAFASNHQPSSAAIAAVTARGKQKIEDMRRVLVRAQQEQQADLSRGQQAAQKQVFSSQLMSLALIAAVALALVLVVVIQMRLEKLQEFVTVCAWTGQVKFQGQWLRLDEYLKSRFDIAVSHSMSQEAADKMMKEIEDLNRSNPPAPPPAD